MWVEARDYDEAWEKIFDDYVEDVLSEFIKKGCDVVIEYGGCRRYEFKGADEYNCETRGIIELSFQEFIEELGYCEFLDLLKEN